MRDFGRDNRGGGRDYGRSGGGRSFGGGNRGGGDREMFKAVCSNCGKDCEVPFKPNGSKPVLCSDCFRNAGGNAGRSDDRGPRQSFGAPRPSFGGDRRDSGPREDKFEALNAKLDKILELLGSNSAPKSSKPARKAEPVVEEVEITDVAPEEKMVEPMVMEDQPQSEGVVEELELNPSEPTVISDKKKKSKKEPELPISE